MACCPTPTWSSSISSGRVTIVPASSKDNDRGSKAVARLRGSATTGMSTDEILALTRA